MSVKYYAEKEGDFIVHFSKENKPVRIEILNAKKFLKETVSSLPRTLRHSTLSL